MVPHFITVQRDVTAWISTHGMPSDLLPHSAHPIGQAFAEGARLVSRYDCCGANLMIPLFAKIVDDGNTLLIRGTKTVDLRRLPMQSGEVLDGIELLLPLLDWSHDDVMRFSATSALLFRRPTIISRTCQNAPHARRGGMKAAPLICASITRLCSFAIRRGCLASPPNFRL